MISVFGIRHHGPGSARSLVKALHTMQPDCLLIESPGDAETAIPFVENEELQTPVALLLYEPDDLKRATYFPFANYSPEWQAIKYGLKHETEVRFMDLPMSLQYTLDKEKEEEKQLSINEENAQTAYQPIIQDPLGYIASIAGYKDSERWWESVFEIGNSETETFTAVSELIHTLRKELGRQESPRTLLREAYMRKMIRKAIKDGFGNIAVICGAWHVPALQNFLNFKVSSDNALLKGIKKTKVKASWVPWSYERLANKSGYGAGVISPAWYELLFENREDVVSQWMARVAQLFREKDFDASPAHVLEAVRLANTLAAMRKKPIPTLEEMEEAALSIFCKGEKIRLDIIRETLIVGNKTGRVPENIPMLPFQKDLVNTIKKARLSKYRENTQEQWLKASKTKPRGGIDLRQETDLLKSHLLHRLKILNIQWGKQQQVSGNELGSFKEYWLLKWDINFSIRFIEVSMWGNTVKNAASVFLLKQVKEESNLALVSEWVKNALYAGLFEDIDTLLKKMQELAAQTHHIFPLMESLSPLVWIVQYGDVRQTNISAVSQLLNELIPRICIGLPGASFNIDDEMTEKIFSEIISTNRAINILDNELHSENWVNTLRDIAFSSSIESKIRGLCTRILFDKSIFDANQTGKLMQFAISTGNSSMEIAQWVEGFLSGNGLLLVHHPALWKLIDEWISALPMESFNEILPLLRRSFSKFSEAERRNMLELAKHPEDSSIFTDYLEEDSFDEGRSGIVMGGVKKILGLI